MILSLGIINHFHIVADSGCALLIVKEFDTVLDDSVSIGEKKFILLSALDDLFYILVIPLELGIAYLVRLIK